MSHLDETHPLFHLAGAPSVAAAADVAFIVTFFPSLHPLQIVKIAKTVADQVKLEAGWRPPRFHKLTTGKGKRHGIAVVIPYNACGNHFI